MHYPINRVKKGVTCADGFTLSIQASSCHYCSPKKDGLTFYDTYEVQSEYDSLLRGRYCKEDGISSQVPLLTVAKLIKKHGGVTTKEGE